MPRFPSTDMKQIRSSQPVLVEPLTTAKVVNALLTEASAYYGATLRDAPKAISYLIGRGISGGVAARYSVGYAAPGWHALQCVLKNYDASAAVESGLCVARADGQSHYDKFRDRIMFPIRDSSGQVVGFGGRVLDGTDPKYMNSPESGHFQKRNLLYGLFEAQQEIKAAGFVVFVEGYIDVLTLSQAGIQAVVSTLGTACTQAQIELALSVTSGVVFCFDGDGAGKRAAEHALETVLPLVGDARTFRFLFLPQDHDPDSFVRENGGEAFCELMKDSKSLSQFMGQICLNGCDLRYAEGRALCCARAKRYWQLLPSGLVKDDLLEFCASASGLSKADLESLWMKH